MEAGWLIRRSNKAAKHSRIKQPNDVRQDLFRMETQSVHRLRARSLYVVSTQEVLMSSALIWCQLSRQNGACEAWRVSSFGWELFQEKRNGRSTINQSCRRSCGSRALSLILRFTWTYWGNSCQSYQRRTGRPGLQRTCLTVRRRRHAICKRC